MQETTPSIHLKRGQSHYAYFRRGTVIRVVTGAVCLTSRIPLEQSVLTVQIPVRSGGVYCVSTSGWLALVADRDSDFGMHLAPSLAGAARRAWGVLRRSTSVSFKGFRFAWS